MIINLLYEKKTISFQACMTQLFIGHFVGGAEILLLVVMAYDRYVAICKPLHYLTVMNQRLGVLLLLLVGVAGFLHAVVQLFFVCKLPFCGPNVIDHYICDMYPLLKLACTDTYIIGLTVVANDGTICVFMFILLLNPCGVILYSLKNVSQEGRHSLIHLWLPRYCDGSLLYTLRFFVCWPPSTLPINKSLVVFYTIITPMLNLLISTPRNGEMKNAMRKLWTEKSSEEVRKWSPIYSEKLLFPGKLCVVF